LKKVNETGITVLEDFRRLIDEYLEKFMEREGR
jgi:hypothetical protein